MRQSKYHRDIPNDAQIKMNRYHQLSKQNQGNVDDLINTIASTGNSRLVTACVQSIIPEAIDKIDEVHRKELNSQTVCLDCGADEGTLLNWFGLP